MRIKQLEFSTDQGAGSRARIGLLVLESDQTLEAEFRALTDVAGVSVYHARLANNITVTPDTLAQMEEELPVAAGLLPTYLGLKSIGYGCTSGSTIIGEDRVAQIINRIHPNVPTTNPLTAAKAALTALGVKRLGLVTPYSPDVTKAIQAKFDEAGIHVAVIGSFYEDNDTVVGKIDPASILRSTVAIGQDRDVDGVFISCTSLQAAGIIPEAETILEKPVTASNHALAWHLMRLAGIPDAIENAGGLFRLNMPSTGSEK